MYMHQKKNDTVHKKPSHIHGLSKPVGHGSESTPLELDISYHIYWSHEIYSYQVLIYRTEPAISQLIPNHYPPIQTKLEGLEKVHL